MSSFEVMRLWKKGRGNIVISIQKRAQVKLAAARIKSAALAWLWFSNLLPF
jgi:hypothetical protein